MNVDMFVSRVRGQLNRLPPYADRGAYDPAVMRAPIPVMRASFSAAALLGQNAGYTLPTLDEFIDLYCCAVRRHFNFQTFARYFRSDETPADGLLYRLCVTYESCIAESYLNVFLVEAIEDRLKQGVVLYDPRADWKLKWDSLVLCKGHVFVINSYWDGMDRRGVETRREARERGAKIRTSVSSQWGNVEIGSFTRIDVARNDANCEILNGFRLFSAAEIQTTLDRIFDGAGVPSAERPTMAQMIQSYP